MYIKFLFVCISYLTSLYCILHLAKFDAKKYSFKKAILITTFYYSLTPIVDFTLLLIILKNFIPAGDYGSGLELITGCVNLIIFIPLYIALGNKMYKAFKQLYPDRNDLYALKYLWEAVVPKTFFVFVATIWIFEVV